MNMKKNILSLLLVAALGASASSNALVLTNGNEVSRSSEGIDLSGITWAGGDTYYAVNDAIHAYLPDNGGEPW